MRLYKKDGSFSKWVMVGFIFLYLMDFILAACLMWFAVRMVQYLVNLLTMYV